MGERPVIVTTSWDDGHELDEKLASLLAEYGLAGTFYIAPRTAEIPPSRRIRPQALCALARDFEVGSHTLTHPHLTRISLSAADLEIRQGTQAVQEMIGQAVTSFCYPYGAYRAEHVGLVRAAGLRSARTIRRFRTDLPTDPLQMGTTSHAARYRADGWPSLRRSRTQRQFVSLWGNWDLLARRLFGEAQRSGHIYHLWGHSWEIEAHGDWSRLRSLLRFLGQQDIVPVTNGELARAVSTGFPEAADKI